MLRLASRNTWQQGDPTRAAVLGQEAIDVLEGLDDTMELGRAIANLAGLRMLARDDGEAVSLAERARAIGERFGDPWTTANALITKGTTLLHADAAAGRALIREGLDLAIASRLPEVALRGYNNVLVGGSNPVDHDRLLAEGIAYAERHGLEQPMLLAGRAFTAFLRGDWDEALVASERVPEGSFWYDGMVVMVRGGIALGRQGPAAALELLRRRAESAVRHTEAQRFVGAVAQLMLVCATADDRAECETWARLLRERAGADLGVARALAGGPINPALVAAAYLRQAEWVDLLAPLVPADDSGDPARGLIASARAFLAGDAARCARETAGYYEMTRARGWGVTPAALVFARELRRDGATLGPEWDAPLAMLREHLERARAGWLLGELAKLEA